jgi:signal transduction histidine kinase
VLFRLFGKGKHSLPVLPANGATSNFLEPALTTLCHKLVRCKNAEFRILVKGRPKRANAEIQKQFYTLGQEALQYAVAHSGATIIETEIEYAHSALRLIIRDNGAGIDPQLCSLGQSSRIALLGIQERAKSIGARFCIWSRRGAGTEFEMSVPFRVAGQPRQEAA